MKVRRILLPLALAAAGVASAVMPPTDAGGCPEGASPIGTDYVFAQTCSPPVELRPLQPSIEAHRLAR